MAEAARDTQSPARPASAASARHGRWRRWSALAVAGLLGACQTLVPRGPSQTAPRAPVAQQAPLGPSDTVIPRDTARNRVALLVPTTGRDAGIGRSIADATQLALLDTGNERVRITTYDTAGAGGAAAAARRAIGEGAELVLGPLLADDVRAAAPVARAAGVPVIAFSNDASAAAAGVYLMGYFPSQSIERVVGYAKSRGVTSFAGLVPAGVYGERSSTAYLRAVEASGGQVVALQTYAPGALAAAVAKLGAKAPYGAVLVADAGRAAAGAAPLLRRRSPAFHLLGTDRWNSENGIAALPGLNGAWFASVSNDLYRQYAAKYRARFGEAPYRLSSLGYDAVLLTVRIARDWPVGRAFPESRLRDPGGFAGIDGAFRFGRDGLAERALAVQEIRGGQLVTVSPAPASFGR